MFFCRDEYVKIILFFQGKPLFDPTSRIEGNNVFIQYFRTIL